MALPQTLETACPEYREALNRFSDGWDQGLNPDAMEGLWLDVMAAAYAFRAKVTSLADRRP